MAVPQPYDVVETGADMLIDFWKDKPVVQGLLKSKLREVQKLEDLTFQVLNERNVNDAIGAQLDVVGSIVGENRLGRLDTPYRQAILNRIALNRSDGTPPVILDLLNILSGSPVPNIFEHYPASLHAYIDRGASHSLAKTLEEISAAGVGARLMFDDGGDSFIGSEIITQDYAAVLENDDGLVVEDTSIEYLLVYAGDRIIPTGDRSYLPEDIQTETINPMCDLILPSLIGELGVIQLENNDVLELENGDILEYQIIITGG